MAPQRPLTWLPALTSAVAIVHRATAALGALQTRVGHGQRSD